MKPETLPSLSALPFLFTAAFLFPTSLPAQAQSLVHPEIVSAWKLEGGNTILIFRYDGTYYQVGDSETRPGMERGKYQWNKATQSFSATAIIDTNGESGLSHPEGATSLSISGNTLTYTVSGEGSFTFSRIVQTGTAIVGSWYIPTDHTTFTFLSDGTYYVTEEENDSATGYDGMEYGTFTWDAGTKILTANPSTDTNGDTGLSHLPPGFTAAVVGNTMTIPDDGETTVLRRINSNTSPLPLPDYEVFKGVYYWQSNTSGPDLAEPVPDWDFYPFVGEASIHASITATAPTLKIGNRNPQPFSIGDEPGEFEIENGYGTLGALNAATAYPNQANFVFRTGNSTSTLNYPIGTNLPEPLAVTTEDSTWVNGTHKLVENETLNWTPVPGYNSFNDLISLDIEDSETEEEVVSALIQGDVTSYDLDGKLETGRTYFVSLSHVKIANRVTSGTGPFSGKIGYAIAESITEFMLELPEESDSPPEIISQPSSVAAEEGEDVILSVRVQDSYPAPAFQWFKGQEELPGQTGNSIALYDLTTEDFGDYTVKVTAAGVTLSSNIATVGDVFSEDAFDAFVSSFQLDAETTGAADFDFDKDGIANLLEFALGGNPRISDSKLLPKLSSAPAPAGRTLVFTYEQRVTATGVTLVTETSPNLFPPWTPVIHGQGNASIAIQLINPTTQKVTVTIPSAGGSRFVRLRAIR